MVRKREIKLLEARVKLLEELFVRQNKELSEMKAAAEKMEKSEKERLEREEKDREERKNTPTLEKIMSEWLHGEEAET